ncbi:anaerobic ribonucleoside-triphosphate reductase activating protein [Duganella qianjiadongensis]|uniref:Anaerobic ribonucleoside-triphosphate reductase activating protein n=1 Tax=Duganella qianjiadongensis TaxID=2692176 RepID=A0ABW9VIR0_9BURK|nr:anaerobic ribonucleoside-triphosphate reductase activating protein [Duganella qianjiadongensis]MYM39493.1 anaerobic ribonucleoside-triphosphate reductase activating protein [Duganella qianjiadongensis]
MTAGALKVGGYTAFSATDYPGQLSAVVFVQGCPWRCGYCHNPHLQERTSASPLAWDSLLAALQRRTGLLDAVVFSGGEATIDPALGEAMAQVRAMGYKVGLHTACIYPARLRSVLPLVDWVGFDVKAPFSRYAGITGIANSGDPARACVEMIMASGVAYECRSTVHPLLLPPDSVLEMAQQLAAMGVQNYVLQPFRSTGCADDSLIASASGDYPPAALEQQLAPLFAQFSVRRHH